MLSIAKIIYDIKAKVGQY